MNTDIIIATYNRAQSLERLVGSLSRCSPAPQHIIVVDSSPEENTSIQKYENVVYIRSSHPNQPYQRYLGYKVSKNDVLVFLDDDMEVLDKYWLKKVTEEFDDKSVVGVAINFKNDNDFLQNKMPKSKLTKSKYLNPLKQFIKTLSGYPQPKAGKFWLCGIRGVQPENGAETEWVSGGAFAARRAVLYKNFNFKLFDLFERKIGMGEDAILGFTLAQHGKIIYLSKEFFYHNDQKDSTYTINFYSFGKRVAYSRLYLSFEYARLVDNSTIVVFMHYIWYMLWRLVGMGINQIIDLKSSRSELIKGYISGILLALKESRSLKNYSDGNDWRKEVNDDINA